MNTNKQLIAIGDVHGKLELLINLIENAIKFDPEKHVLVFLGDFIDRGENSKGVVDFVIALREKHPTSVVLLKGNHEMMAHDFLVGKSKWALWGQNGGDATVASFGRNMKLAKDTLIPFIESLPNFLETETHIFVHGGIQGNASPKNCTAEQLLWTRGVRNWTGDKTLVVGHTPMDEVTELPNKVFMVDTCAFHTGKLSALNTATGEVFQSIEEKVVVLTVKKTTPKVDFVVDAITEETDEEEFTDADAVILEKLEREFKLTYTGEREK